MIKIKWDRFFIDHVIFGVYIVVWDTPPGHLPMIGHSWNKDTLYDVCECGEIPWHRCFRQDD